MNPRNASWTGTLAVVMAVKTKVGVEKVTEQSTVDVANLLFGSSRFAFFSGGNLLGAVVGGVLENAVMIGGRAALGWLAFFIYVLSAVCLIRSQHTGKAPRFAKTPPGLAQDSG
jgi:predicted MFS family arabinose efflux permease